MSGSRRRAIVAEDEPLIRMQAVTMLDALGFEVLEADCAHITLHHLERSERVSLLYTDARMPGGMSGFDLAHTVALRWPETGIIVCSGWEQDIEGLPEDAHFIAKPCTEQRLREALEALSLQ
ncbi:response regulator [Methylobacterium sp. P31]